MLVFLLPFLWVLACTLFVSYELGWGCFWVTVVAAVAAHFFLGFSIFTLAVTSPLLLVKYGLAYMGIGLGWASLKFFIKLRKARSSYVKDKKAWLSEDVEMRSRLGDVVNPSPVRTEEDWITKVKRTNTENYAPTVYMNKNRIMFWAWWWPFSIVSFLFEDLIQELWNASWKCIKNIMEGIRKMALGEAARDLD